MKDTYCTGDKRRKGVQCRAVAKRNAMKAWMVPAVTEIRRYEDGTVPAITDVRGIVKWTESYRR